MDAPLAARSLRHRAKLLAERLSGFRLFRRLPHGIDACADIRATGHPIRMILDVGANVGQSAALFRESFPAAAIHSFEPARATYDALVANVAGMGVHCHRLALGDAPGEAHLRVLANTRQSHLVTDPDGEDVETVTVATVDGFLDEHGIDAVDLLKVDAEGHDLAVVAGAEQSLARSSIAFVLVEVGFVEGGRHVPLGAIRSRLEAHGLCLLGLYDQTPDWSGARRLRFANALFARAAR